jgi:phage shock protein PspC (stress-responsive transcriptional regulator)
MGIADDLVRLGEMHARGALSDDEFQRAKARLLDASASPEVPSVDAINRMRRSRGDRWIAGVCGGVAVITGVESWIWRLILAVLALFGGTGVLLYILLWIFVPDE